MTRKIIVTDSNYAPIVNDGDVMTVVGEFRSGNVRATLDGGDGFVWFMKKSEFEEYEPQKETPTLWRDMTDAEKGALLLAHHEGKVIEMTSHIPGTSRLAWNECPSNWKPTCTGIYRIKPEPKRQTVTLQGHVNDWNQFMTDSQIVTHRITFNLINGKPDTSSIKMETL